MPFSQAWAPAQAQTKSYQITKQSLGDKGGAEIKAAGVKVEQAATFSVIVTTEMNEAVVCI